jgi:hypothetical protein
VIHKKKVCLGAPLTAHAIDVLMCEASQCRDACACREHGTMKAHDRATCCMHFRTSLHAHLAHKPVRIVLKPYVGTTGVETVALRVKHRHTRANDRVLRVASRGAHGKRNGGGHSSLHCGHGGAMCPLPRLMSRFVLIRNLKFLELESRNRTTLQCACIQHMSKTNPSVYAY